MNLFLSIFKIKNIKLTGIFLFILMINGVAQTKSNLEIFYGLVDSSVAEIISELPEGNKYATIKLNLGNDYSLFNNHLITGFRNGGVDLIDDPALNNYEINYVIDNARVDYGEIYRDGFLGDFYILRKIIITGNYLLTGNFSATKKFNYTYQDSVKVDNIKNLENSSFPFTEDEVPPEPFFSGILEPVVAITAAAVAAFLFFTVRSK